MSNNPCDCDVIIVGAGLSGLTCAYLLQESGLSTIILEAADRIGGRIHSVYHPGNQTSFADLGPTWVWPKYQPVIEQWLSHLKISTFAQYETGLAVQDFGPEQPVTHRRLPSQNGIRRINNGPQALVDAVAKKLSNKTIKQMTSVNSITLVKDDICVRTDNLANRSFRAKIVVLCAPLRVIQQSITMPDELDAGALKIMKQMPTWMATQAKAVISYETPFWRQGGLSGRVASEVGPLVEIHDHSPSIGSSGALFGFIGWSPNDRLSNPAQLKEKIIDQLVRCFGDEAAKFNDFQIKDWARDANICSSLDLTTPPVHPEIAPDFLRKPLLSRRIFIGVSEAARQSPGLIEGALISAMDTSNQVLASLKPGNS